MISLSAFSYKSHWHFFSGFLIYIVLFHVGVLVVPFQNFGVHCGKSIWEARLRFPPCLSGCRQPLSGAKESLLATNLGQKHHNCKNSHFYILEFQAFMFLSYGITGQQRNEQTIKT